MVAKKVFRTYSVFVALRIIYPAVLAAVITFVVRPGFMSFDTIHALDAANDGVTDSAWPPMVSYIWRFVNIFSPTPSLMQFLQIFLLLASVFAIVLHFVDCYWQAFPSLVFYLLIPVVLGTVIVIWKDVLTAAFVLAGIALLFTASKVQRKIAQASLIVVAIGLLFLGTTTRHNTISAVIPIACYLGWLIVGSSRIRTLFRVGIAVLLGLVLSGVLYSGKVFLDNYSLPDLQIISGTEEFLPSERILDLGGASICAQVSFFKLSAPNLSLNEIQSAYDARHVNLSAELIRKVPNQDFLAEDWTQALQQNPWCLSYQKRQTAKYLLGFNQGDQFLITNAGIFENKYGYSLAPSATRDALVSYIESENRQIYMRPWVFFIIGIVALLVAFLGRRKIDLGLAAAIQLSVLWASGVLYFTGLVLLGNAADARLLFYTNSVNFVVCFIVAVFLLRKVATKVMRSN